MAGFAFSLATSCAKKREAKLPDEQVNGTFAISEIESASFKVQSTQNGSSTANNDFHFNNETSQVSIDGSDAPERFRFMFHNLEVKGKSKNSVDVFFTVDRNYLTAYKLARIDSLTSLERSYALSSDQLKSKIKTQKLRTHQRILGNDILSESDLKKMSNEDSSALTLVPLFKYKVVAHGVVENVKNEVKEDTSVLKLRKTEWENATHIQISDMSHDRVNIEFDVPTSSNTTIYLSTDKINNKILSHSQINELFAIDLEGDEKTNYLVVVEQTKINIYSESEKDVEKKSVLATIQSEQLDVTLKTEKGIESNLVVLTKNNGKLLGSITKIEKN